MYRCYSSKGIENSSWRDSAVIRSMLVLFVYFFLRTENLPRFASIYFYSLREKLSSMNLLLYMAPFSILFLFPAALLMEHNVIAITTTLYQNNLVSASEFSPCISCQLDQFLGHQTHQSFNSTGLGKCKVHRGCGHLNIDI